MKRTEALSVTFSEVQSSNPIKCTALNTSHSMTQGNDVTVSKDGLHSLLSVCHGFKLLNQCYQLIEGRSGPGCKAFAQLGRIWYL